MNWEDIILEFCMDITVRGFSKITIKNYKSKLRNTANFFKSINVEPSQIEKKQIKSWIIDMQEKEMQASTINVSVSRLKKLFDYMLIEKYIDYNPFVDIERLKEQRKVIYPLNDYEIKQMLTVAKKHPYKHIAQRNVTIFLLEPCFKISLREVSGVSDQ